VLFIVFLVLSIGFLQNLMDLMEDASNPLNEYGGFVDLRLNIGRFCLCGCKRWCNISGTQGLESQPHLKWAMAGGVMEILVVTVLNIGETLISCTQTLRVVHAQDVHNHLIYNLCLVVGLGVESSGFSELGVQQ
jgi:hypothetical protein